MSATCSDSHYVPQKALFFSKLQFLLIKTSVTGSSTAHEEYLERLLLFLDFDLDRFLLPLLTTDLDLPLRTTDLDLTFLPLLAIDLDLLQTLISLAFNYAQQINAML